LSLVSAAAIELRSRNCIEIGLVNDMLDAALEATERQFVALIRAATTDTVVRLRLYALPDVPRGERRLETASRYRDVSELWDSRLDGLIVTGTEPRAADLREEPYCRRSPNSRIGRVTTRRRQSGRAWPPTRRCCMSTASSGDRWHRSSSAYSIAG
jgi:hypothetical protein